MSIRVSIHAPVRVRHGDTDPVFYQYDVSIHAPVRVRPLNLTHFYFSKCFNSRTREGVTLSG